MKNDLKFDKLDAWDARNNVSWKARNLVARKAKKLKLAFCIIFMLVVITWIFDQVEGLFKMGHHVHHVFKSFKQRIDEFRSYLLSKKQFGLDNKLGFDFVHKSMDIRVLQYFVSYWKGVQIL